MSFHLTSKFIGSQKLLSEKVVQTYNINAGWADYFLFDDYTVASAPTYAVWTPAVVATGTINAGTNPPQAELVATVANNDEASLTSLAACSVITANVSEYITAVWEVVDYSDTSDGTTEIREWGIYQDATHYIVIRKSDIATPDNYDLITRNGGAEVVMESVAIDPAEIYSWTIFYGVDAAGNKYFSGHATPTGGGTNIPFSKYAVQANLPENNFFLYAHVKRNSIPAANADIFLNRASIGYSYGVVA